MRASRGMDSPGQNRGYDEHKPSAVRTGTISDAEILIEREKIKKSEESEKGHSPEGALEGP